MGRLRIDSDSLACRRPIVCGVVGFTPAAWFPLRDVQVRSCSTRPDTRSASSRRSATRSSARPLLMTISGSGAATSVHGCGTEQMRSPSTRRRSRIPYRLYRSPTQTSCRPLSGWNGWVTRTRRVPRSEGRAFRGELQATRARSVPATARGGIGRGPRAARGAGARAHAGGDRPARREAEAALGATAERALRSALVPLPPGARCDQRGR